MTPDVRITLASNRGPVSFVRTDGSFETKRGAGGLAGALDPVARGLGDGALWIAAATSPADSEAIAAGEPSRLREELGYRVELIDIDPSVYAVYYDDVSNGLLWFANHGLWDEVGVDPGPVPPAGWAEAYVPVNERFARGIALRADDDALALVQDYHLSLVPGMLRKLAPNVTSLHFTHSSFCGFDEGIGRLPAPLPTQLVEGMLGADLVGFHEQRWARNFLECCKRTGFDVDESPGRVRIGDRFSWVRCYPIPIDAADLAERAKAQETQGWATRILDWANGRTLVVRSDRMEPSKNIVRGFEAFGSMLDAEPELRDRVCFVACVYPSRENVPEYQRYADLITGSVDAVNARHPDSVALFTEDDFDRSLGALAVYDVLLVNSIMDGMNLVSKEGPSLNRRDGVLVLSRGAGSFEEMREGAMIVQDPFDVQETAVRLREAIHLDGDERKRRAELLRKAATARVPEDWVNSQIEDLVAIRAQEPPVTSWEQIA
jgi:trehalose 6-phosphate synthase